MKEMICKVQKSIVSTDKEVHVLVYNKDRSIMEEYTDSQEDMRVVEFLGRLGGRDKAYFNAQVNETGIKLLEEVEQQEW